MNQVTVNGEIRANVILYAVNNNKNEFIFMSIVDKSSIVKQVASALNHRADTSYARLGKATIPAKSVDYYISKDPESDYSNLVAWRKDGLVGSEASFYVFTRGNKDDRIGGIYDLNTLVINQDEGELINKFYDSLYEKILKNTSVPVLRSWMQYITKKMMDDNLVNHYSVYPEDNDINNFDIFQMNFSSAWLRDTISNALHDKEIIIKENATISPEMLSVTGLDSYLNTFSETLTKKIQDSFVPKFNPKTDKVSDRLNLIKDYICWKSNFKMDLFPAQQTVIQAMCNHLDKNKTGILIGEMGVGYLPV